MTLRGFSLEVLDSVASPSRNPGQTVELAAGRYLADRTLRPPGWRCLPLDEDPPEDGDGPALEVDLSEPTFERLTAEAAAQGVSLDALVSHVVMYAWAAERAPAPPPAPRGGSGRRRSTSPARSDHRSRT